MEKPQNTSEETKAEHGHPAHMQKKTGASTGFKIAPLHVFAAVIVLAVIAAAYITIGGGATTVVAVGDNVQVNYTGSFTNGTIFDASAWHNQSLNFTVGANEVIPGFDRAVIGMKLGGKKTVIIPPAEAYGPVNASLIIHIPTNVLEADLNATPTVGMPITDRAGQRAIITAVNPVNVTVDFNPPLAGQTLVFNITVVGIHKKA